MSFVFVAMAGIYLIIVVMAAFASSLVSIASLVFTVLVAFGLVELQPGKTAFDMALVFLVSVALTACLVRLAILLDRFVQRAA